MGTEPLVGSMAKSQGKGHGYGVGGEDGESRDPNDSPSLCPVPRSSFHPMSPMIFQRKGEVIS